MSAVVHWLPKAVINGRLACGRSCALRASSIGTMYETPLYVIEAKRLPRGYRWCVQCRRRRQLT